MPKICGLKSSKGYSLRRFQLPNFPLCFACLRLCFALVFVYLLWRETLFVYFCACLCLCLSVPRLGQIGNWSQGVFLLLSSMQIPWIERIGGVLSILDTYIPWTSFGGISWREPRIYGLNKRFLIGLCVWFLLVDFLECGRHFSSCPRFPLSGLKFRFLIARFEGFISHQNVAHAPPEKYTKISRYVAR